MKNKILAAVVPVAAFAALAGTGFGSWYFAQAGASASASASVAVTGVSPEDGTVAVDHATFYLGLDQTNGCYWTTKMPTAEDTVNEGFEAANGQISVINVTYTLGNNVNYNAIDKSVIGMTAAWASTGTNEYVTLGDTAESVELTWAENVASGTFALPTLAWAKGKKPQTMSAYDTMVKALAKVSFTLTFTTTVSA